MAEFFDQICRILTETAVKHPGHTPSKEELDGFFKRPEKAAVPLSQSLPESGIAPALPEMPVAGPLQKPASPAPVLPPAQSSAAGNGTLAELAQSVAGCQKCPLCRHRKNTVFGEGAPAARLMFIGEAPGYDEDIQGRPFVGKAGQLLNKMIAAMQFTRQEVYIANIVKCRPDGNRNPAPDEVDACIPYLHRQIELIRPEVIVVLGAVAARALLRHDGGISKLRGRWCSYENIPVMPTFHPAFLLRQESAKKEAWLDLQQVMKRFGKTYVKR